MSRSATAGVAPVRRRLGVVLVDPLPVVRAGLALLIDGSEDLEVLSEPSDADTALASLGRVRRTRVVVLVGLALSGTRDAPWLIRTIRERFPAHAVLALGADADATTISHALFVGADGFVDKNVAPAATSRTRSSDAERWSSALLSGSARSCRSPPRGSPPDRSRVVWGFASGP